MSNSLSNSLPDISSIGKERNNVNPRITRQPFIWYKSLSLDRFPTHHYSSSCSSSSSPSSTSSSGHDDEEAHSSHILPEKGSSSGPNTISTAPPSNRRLLLVGSFLVAMGFKSIFDCADYENHSQQLFVASATILPAAVLLRNRCKPNRREPTQQPILRQLTVSSLLLLTSLAAFYLSAQFLTALSISPSCVIISGMTVSYVESRLLLWQTSRTASTGEDSCRFLMAFRALPSVICGGLATALLTLLPKKEKAPLDLELMNGNGNLTGTSLSEDFLLKETTLASAELLSATLSGVGLICVASAAFLFCLHHVALANVNSSQTCIDHSSKHINTAVTEWTLPIHICVAIFLTAVQDWFVPQSLMQLQSETTETEENVALRRGGMMIFCGLGGLVVLVTVGKAIDAWGEGAKSKKVISRVALLFQALLLLPLFLREPSRQVDEDPAFFRAVAFVWGAVALLWNFFILHFYLVPNSNESRILVYLMIKYSGLHSATSPGLIFPVLLILFFGSAEVFIERMRHKRHSAAKKTTIAMC